MCIIIVKPAGKIIHKWVLRNSWENNDDGAGFAYAKDGKIVIVKELHKFKRFWKIYQSHQLDNYNVLLHFRIGTSGHHNLENTHPFLINESHALVHNGILSCVQVPSNSPINDTQIFIKDYLACTVRDGDGGPVDWVNSQLARKYVEDIIGKSNKIAVLNNEGEAAIWNEDAGHWHSECWFSNRSYEDRPYRYTGWQGGYQDGSMIEWREWERRWNGVNDNETYLTEWEKNRLSKPAWPDSENLKLLSGEETDIDEGHSQQCLECGVLLSTLEINQGYGCCEECVHRAFEGA